MKDIFMDKLDIENAIAWKPEAPSMGKLAEYSKQGWVPAPATGLGAILNAGVILGIGGAGLHGALVGADSHHSVAGHHFDAGHSIGNLPAFDSGPIMNGAHMEPFVRNDPPASKEQADTMLVRGFVPADGNSEGTYGIVTLHPGSEQPIDLLIAHASPGDESKGELLTDATLVGGSDNWGNVAELRQGGSVTRNSAGEIISGGELEITGYTQHLKNGSTNWESIAKMLADGGVKETDASFAKIKAAYDKGEPINLQVFNTGPDANGDTIFQTLVADGDGDEVMGPKLKVSTEFSKTVAALVSGAKRLKDKITGNVELASYNIGPDPVITPTPSETPAPTAVSEADPATVLQLASNLVCMDMRGCIREEIGNPSMMEVDAAATGIFKTVRLQKEDGTEFATALMTEMVTRSKDEQARAVWVPVQVETDDNKGMNSAPMFSGAIIHKLGGSIQDIQTQSDIIFPLERYTKYITPGSKWDLQFPKSGATKLTKYQGSQFTRPDYIQRLKEFLASGGDISNFGPEVPILIPSLVDFAN